METICVSFEDEKFNVCKENDAVADTVELRATAGLINSS